jgi:hypothetical protein
MSVPEGNAESEFPVAPFGSESTVPDDYMAEIITAQRNDAISWAGAISVQLTRLGITDNSAAFFRSPIAEFGAYYLMISRQGVKVAEQYEGSLLKVVLNQRERDAAANSRRILSREYIGCFDCGTCEISTGTFSFRDDAAFKVLDLPLTQPPIIWPDVKKAWRLWTHPNRVPVAHTSQEPTASFDGYYDYCRLSESVVGKLRLFDEDDRIS